MLHRFRWALALAVSCLVFASCEARNDTPGARAAPPAAPPSGSGAPSANDVTAIESSADIEADAPYPPARWRLVPVTSLAPCVLWVSHILVRHEGTSARAPFDGRPAAWTPLPPAPSRTRAQALALAAAHARSARRDPARFAELARTQSDDVTTRDQGGSLGGLGAASFRDWPQVLDALATLQPGDVSRPVETEFGFHVFQRRAPPARATVSGRRLIVAYDDARWLREHLAGREIPARSRAEAQALATGLYQRARENPQGFDALIAQHSDHRDVARGGDFGRWSTRDRAPFARSIEQLASLEVGAIAAPIETFLGFEIIQRTPERERVSYAFSRIQHTVDAAAPLGSPRSRQQTWQQLVHIASVLHEQPERFEEFQASSCCRGFVSQWEEGRESVLDERMLSQLAIGQISGAPIELSPLQYAIVQRLEPAPGAPEPSTCVELPSPEAPDVTAFFSSTGQLGMLQQAQREAQRELGSSDEQRADMDRLFAIEPAWRAARTSSDKRRLLDALDGKLSSLLGQPAYSRYRRLVAQRVEQTLLRGGRALWQRGELNP